MSGPEPEPILDIVRGLSTVASAVIIANQVRSFWEEVFTSTCTWCQGAGAMTCPHCKGTKSMRAMPALVDRKNGTITDSCEEFFPCVYCGPLTDYDIDVEREDDEAMASKLQDNLQAAIAGKPRPHTFPLYAGVVPCPECQGSPVIHRHTPNFNRFFKLDPTWEEQIIARLGFYNQQQVMDMVTPDSRGWLFPPAPRYLEYPKQPPGFEGGPSAIPQLCPDDDEYEQDDSPHAQADQGSSGSMAASKQLRTEDFVIKYIEDTEE